MLSLLITVAFSDYAAGEASCNQADPFTLGDAFALKLSFDCQPDCVEWLQGKSSERLPGLLRHDAGR